MSVLSDAAAQFRCPEGAYLMSHSVGCLPREAASRLAAGYFAPWAAEAGDAWPAWLGVIEEFRRSLARLLGGDADDYCPQANLSSGLTKVIQALPASAGREAILSTASDFPSMGFVLAQSERRGHRVERLPDRADIASPDVWAEALREHVGVALLTHVHYQTGVRIPVTEIVALCRERGVVTIVDVAQSAGVVPFDVAEWQADFVVGSCVKWLCGGSGAGYLWVNPRRADEWEPQDVGWFSHADPFEFDIDHFDYAPRAARFWGGTPSIAPYAVATAGLELLGDVGLDAISTHNRAMTQRVVDALPPSALRSPPNADDRGGTIIFSPPDLERSRARLEQAQIWHDVRGGGIRLSPHLYNDVDQIDRLVDLLPED